MENLEKSWNLKMVISTPGKVKEKTEIIKVLEKSQEFVRSQYAKCSKLFMFIPRFQFGLGHLV